MRGYFWERRLTEIHNPCVFHLCLTIATPHTAECGGGLSRTKVTGSCSSLFSYHCYIVMDAQCGLSWNKEGSVEATVGRKKEKEKEMHFLFLIHFHWVTSLTSYFICIFYCMAKRKAVSALCRGEDLLEAIQQTFHLIRTMSKIQFISLFYFLRQQMPIWKKYIQLWVQKIASGINILWGSRHCWESIYYFLIFACIVCSNWVCVGSTFHVESKCSFFLYASLYLIIA